MNTDLLTRHVRKLDDQGLCLDEIGERCGHSPQYVCNLRTQEPKDVSCDRCAKPLSYYSAVRIGVNDFCKQCRAELFENHDAACVEFPDLFCAEA